MITILPKPLLLASLATIGVSPALAQMAAGQRIEQGGITVSFDYQALGDGSGVAHLALSDAHTGRAIEGARPAAWIVARRSEQVAEEASCEDKARALVAGSLGQRADADLNGYRLLTLNHDRTVAFINPLVRLGNTQLESIVELPAEGHDWLLAPRAQRLAVSLRDAGVVALIDTVARKLVAAVPTGPSSLPTRLALDPDGRRLWVGLDGRAEVLAIDLQTSRVEGRASVGRGVHTLVASEQSSQLFVTNGDSNTVSLVDRTSLQTVAEVPVGATPVASAWSPAARRLAVLSLNGGSLALIDGEARTVQATIPLARGAMVLGLFDEGRRALVLNRLDDTLSLLDLARARKTAERKLPARPDQLTFSREFAFVRSQSTSAMQVIALAQAREDRLDSVAVPMGQSAPQDAPDALNEAASVLVPAPEGNGVLVANAGDGRVYRYAQGLMVPVNSHSNYRRHARGLLVLDSSLAERAPGQFEAPARLARSGRYDVVVRNLRPAITACFTLAVQGVPATIATAAPPKPRLLASRRLDHNTVELDFVLSEVAAGTPVALLLVQHAGTWQGRTWAAPLESGRYRARLRGLPHGTFEAMVEASSGQLAFFDGRLGRVKWPLPQETSP